MSLGLGRDMMIHRCVSNGRTTAPTHVKDLRDVIFFLFEYQ